MKTRSEIEESADAPSHRDAAAVRASDSADQSKQRGFTSAIAPDDTDHASGLHFEIDIVQTPEVLRGLQFLKTAHQRFVQRPGPIKMVAPKAFTEVLNYYCVVVHLELLDEALTR
jgi:hypothetical protein